MANPNRWALREAGEATFFDVVSGEPIVTLNTLKMSDVATSSETVYAQGGRGNPKIVPFSGNKESQVTLQDAIFDNLALAMLTGNSVVEGAKTVDAREILTPVDAVTPVKLKKDGVTITGAYLLDADGKTKIGDALEAGVDYTLTAGSPDTITFDGYTSGDKYIVYYSYTTAADAKTIKVTADSFGGVFRLVVDVLVRDEHTAKDYYAQFRAPRAKLNDEFSFEFAPDGDPSVLDIPIELLKDPESEDIWEFIIYGLKE